MLSLKDRASWTGAQARNQFRQNFFPEAHTNGMSTGFTQTSVHIIPSIPAENFAEFCKVNHAPCPLLYRSKPGEVSAPPLAADLDIRTDQSAYGIYENGVCTKTVTDLLNIPFDDFVTFHVGCSSSFELALLDAGLPVRHIQVGRSVPSYKTKVPCIPSGPLSGDVVMSMRPMPRNLVERAAQVTAVLDQVHGAPTHIGHPSWIGVEDLQNPEFDDKPNIKEGDVCMFWGCGTTATMALINAKLPLVISLSPTANCCNFITDLNNEDFNKMNTPKWAGSLQTKALFISEKPVFGSLMSDKALELIRQLEKLDKQDALKPVLSGEPDKPVDSLAKAALRLSHASSVAIVTSNDISTRQGFSVLSIIKSLLATESKEIVLLVPEEKHTEWRNAISSCVDSRLLKKRVDVRKIEARDGSSKDDVLQISRRVLSTMEGFKMDDVIPRKFSALVGCDKEGGLWVESVPDLMAEADVHDFSKTSESSWPGEVVAAALYILNCCPIHSRYLRRGLGLYKPLQQSEFLMTSEELAKLTSKFDVRFSTQEVKDLVNKTNSSALGVIGCLDVDA